MIGKKHKLSVPDFAIVFCINFIHNKGIELKIGRTHAREQTPKILKLIEKNKFDPSKITSQIVNFDEAAEAWLEPGRKLIVRGTPE